MSFTFTNARRLTPEESNPLSSLLSNALKGYEQGIDLRKKKTSLEYLPKQLQAALALQQAQTGESGARTGLLGEQTKQAQLNNQYLPQQLQSKIQQSLLQQHLMNQIIGGQSPSSLNMGSGSTNGIKGMNSGGSQMGGMNSVNEPQDNNVALEQSFKKAKMMEERFGADSPEAINAMEEFQQLAQADQQQASGNQNKMSTGEESNHPISQAMQQPQKQQAASHQLTYPQIALAHKALGLGEPKIENINGQYTALSPLGNTPVAQGLSEEQKAFQSSLGKTKGKEYEDSINAFNGYQAQAVPLQVITESLEHNPEFRNVVGPINKPITNWIGTPEQQELLGTLQTASGEIALQVAPSLKGAWTGRDQALVDSIKASPKDFPDVFIGKLKAQTLINNVLGDRAKIRAEYIEKGDSPLVASKKAAQDTPLDKYKSMIHNLTIKNNPDVQELNGKKYKFHNGTWDEIK